jgi:hypothetical protein
MMAGSNCGLVASRGPAERRFARAAGMEITRRQESRETDASLVSPVDVNGFNKAYVADRSGHY